MKYAGRIKPISYLKANAAKVVRGLAESGEPMIITQNGEARAVIQDIVSYEQKEETLALLKILALANQNIEQGRYRPAKAVFRDLRRKLKADKIDK
jgi:prevent-host-death family protein